MIKCNDADKVYSKLKILGESPYIKRIRCGGDGDIIAVRDPKQSSITIVIPSNIHHVTEIDNDLDKLKIEDRYIKIIGGNNLENVDQLIRSIKIPEEAKVKIYDISALDLSKCQSGFGLFSNIYTEELIVSKAEINQKVAQLTFCNSNIGNIEEVVRRIRFTGLSVLSSTFDGVKRYKDTIDLTGWQMEENCSTVGCFRNAEFNTVHIKVNFTNTNRHIKLFEYSEIVNIHMHIIISNDLYYKSIILNDVFDHCYINNLYIYIENIDVKKYIDDVLGEKVYIASLEYILEE